MSKYLKLCQSRLSVATLEQIGAAQLYNCSDKYIKNVNLKYRKRRDTLLANLNEIEGIQYSIPEGAFYVIVKLPIEDAEAFCIWLLQEFNYNNEMVMLCPAKDFYKSEGMGKDEVRITYVQDQDILERSINILKIALSLYRNKN